MTTDTAPQSSGRLQHLGVLRFSGPEASSFLQGQVSNDTRRLAQGQSLLAAYSSPQGRVLALMHLLPHSSGVIAILPRDLVLPTWEGLRKFVLRAKVKIEDPGEAIAVAGHHGAHGLQSAGIGALPPGPGYVEAQGIGVAAVNHDPGRYWVIGAAERLAEIGLACGPGDADGSDDGRAAGRMEQDWRLADIRAGLPQIYLATRETFVAQMLNLDLLDGISFTKGCYTGQEIIARTQHLGRIKRRLHRLALPAGGWTLGQALRLPDGRTGRLTELAPIGEQFESLAVLTRPENAETDSAGAATTSAATIAATELPLPYPVIHS
jgi:folate-binding protein YgfZ